MFYSTNDSALDLARRFTHHPPKGNQVGRYVDIRDAGHTLATKIDEECPPSREKSLALTKIEEGIMWANAAIARNEAEMTEPSTGSSDDASGNVAGQIGGG